MSSGERIASLSAEALVYAVRLNSDDVSLVARRLYMYNTEPMTRRWAQLLQTRVEAGRFLGIRPQAAWRRRLSRSFNEERGVGRRGPWRLWVNRSNDRSVLRHKVYVSPVPKATPDALAAVAATCAAMDVPAFKVGADLAGVLRPDKIIVYVSHCEAIGAVASELQINLRSVDAQGVPFTSQIGDTGLLSWAVDPVRGPEGAPAGVWSWRTDVAWRLADSITRSRDRGNTASCVDAALARLRADGIDPVGWHARDDR